MVAMTHPRGQAMQGSMSRRLFVLAGTLTITSVARAQQAMNQLIGRWKGHVPGLGDAEIIVVAVRANGQVDGQMVFPDQNKTFALGDKLDIVNSINHGVIRGSSLTIETAMGGTYRLDIGSSSLNGEYVRGTTYKVPVTFQKVS
jgi:hypothetical protein